jgi:hypothetical protein
MKISEMIKNLQEFVTEHGDIDCWYAEDDEGNAYHEVYFSPRLLYVNKYDDVFTKEDFNEADEDDKEDLTPICIVN